MVFSLFCVCYADEGVNTVEVQSTNHYAEMDVDSIVKELIKIDTMSTDINDLINPAVVLYDKSNDIDEVSLKAMMQSNSISDNVKYVLVEIAEAKNAEGNFDELFCNWISDENINSELRKRCIWAASATIELQQILCKVIFEEDSEVSLQALKRFYDLNQEKGLEIAENIFRDYRNSGIHELREATRIVSKNIGGLSTVNKASFVDICKNIVAANMDQKLNNNILYCINDVGTVSDIYPFFESDNIDYTLKYDLMKCNEEKYRNVISTNNFSTLEKEAAKGLLSLFNQEAKDLLSVRAVSATNYSGHAVYNAGGSLNQVMGYGHAGLMIATNTGSNNCLVHITSLLRGVEKDTWDGFMDDSTFNRICRPQVSQSVFNNKKANVVNLANRLTTQDIIYTLAKQIAYVDNPVGTIKYSPEDIIQIRCDGVVEYCYEYYDMEVYASPYYPDYWDISKIGNYALGHVGSDITPALQASTYLTTVSYSEP